MESLPAGARCVFVVELESRINGHLVIAVHPVGFLVMRDEEKVLLLRA
jgi:hypothetical protein